MLKSKLQQNYPWQMDACFQASNICHIIFHFTWYTGLKPWFGNQPLLSVLWACRSTWIIVHGRSFGLSLIYHPHGQYIKRGYWSCYTLHKSREDKLSVEETRLKILFRHWSLCRNLSRSQTPSWCSLERTSNVPMPFDLDQVELTLSVDSIFPQHFNTRRVWTSSQEHSPLNSLNKHSSEEALLPTHSTFTQGG